jgi:TonB family protein
MSIQIVRKLLLLFFFGCASFFCAAQQVPTPSQLIEQANAASDLSKLASYRLKAIVAVSEGKQVATGTLTVDHDQQNTRHELEFADYHEVSLTRGDTGYFQRNPSINLYVAERIRDFDELWWVGIPPESEVGEVSPAKVHGVHALCFTVKPDKFTKTRYCFDATTHLLLSHTADDLEILFQDYQELDGVRFPTTIHFSEENRVAMEVRKVAAVKMVQEPALFEPPKGSRAFHTCQHLMPPRPVKLVKPEYPPLAQAQNIPGTVHLLITVDEDGNVKKVTPLRGSPQFVESATNALKQREYKPALCPSGPVEHSRIVVFHFHAAPSHSKTDSGIRTRPF